jgi:hypothetical protein
MRHRSLLHTFCASWLCLCLCLTATAQARRHATNPANNTSGVNAAGRQAATQALARLQALRDGWNDVNRAYIVRNFEMGQKLNPSAYELQYLETKVTVAEALDKLPKTELRTAILQAMELFDDLEDLEKIFEKKSPLATTIYISDVFYYLKKYHVPYEEGMEQGIFGFKLHKDFVLSYVLPQRYALVNRVEVLLGGKPAPVPPPPTYEQMFSVPKQKPPLDRASVKAGELKEIARQALEARLHGDRTQMSALLDDQFSFYGPEGQHLDKQMYLQKMRADPAVKAFEIERAELSFWDDTPVLATTVMYESFLGQFKSFKNTFHFVNRGGRWLIAAWLAA